LTAANNLPVDTPPFPLNTTFKYNSLFDKHADLKLKDVKVTSYQKYETTAVSYKMIFLLEFMFDGEVPLEKEVAVLKEFQEFFRKV